MIDGDVTRPQFALSPRARQPMNRAMDRRALAGLLTGAIGITAAIAGATTGNPLPSLVAGFAALGSGGALFLHFVGDAPAVGDRPRDGPPQEGADNGEGGDADTPVERRGASPEMHWPPLPKEFPAHRERRTVNSALPPAEFDGLDAEEATAGRQPALTTEPVVAHSPRGAGETEQAGPESRDDIGPIAKIGTPGAAGSIPPPLLDAPPAGVIPKSGRGTPPSRGPESVFDTDTGLLDERVFIVSLERKVAAARRHLRPLTLVLVDVTSGLPADQGEQHNALTSFGAVVRETMRDSDIACRIGSSNFALILEDTPEAGGVWAAERLQIAMACANTPLTRMVASVATYPNHGLQANEVLQRGRAALVRARNSNSDGLGPVEVAKSD